MCLCACAHACVCVYVCVCVCVCVINYKTFGGGNDGVEGKMWSGWNGH